MYSCSKPLEFLYLKRRIRLKLQRYIADFVQKKRSFVSSEASGFLRYSPGKRSFFVAEQLTLKKSKRDCRAVQLHECFFAATAQLMDPTRNRVFQFRLLRSAHSNPSASTTPTDCAAFNTGLCPTIFVKL